MTKDTNVRSPAATQKKDEPIEVPLLPRLATYRDPNVPLPLDKEQVLQLTVNSFVSNRTFISGQSGSGKGNAGMLIAEFLVEAGLPCTFVDFEGEAWSLKELCSNLLVVGRSVHADREYPASQMGRLAELSVEQGFSVILDLSGYDESEIFALLLPYLQSVWAACDRLRTPYHLIIDELHEVAPEQGTTPLKPLLRRIAKRGRKRGLGYLAMSQDAASVDKKLLRQTDIRILLAASYEGDLKAYHEVIPGATLATIKQTVPAFPKGMGYVVVEHHAFLVQLHRRRTYDPSETPKLGTHATEPVLRTIDSATLQILDKALPLSPGEEMPLERLDRASLIGLVRELRQHQPTNVQNSHKAVGGTQKGADRNQQRLMDLQHEKEQLQEELRQKQARIEQLEALVAHIDGSSAPAELHIGEFRPHIEAATLEIGTVQETQTRQKDANRAPAQAGTPIRTRGKPSDAAPTHTILTSERDLLARLIRRVENLWPVEKRLLWGGRSEAVIKCKVATFILVFSFHFSS